MAKRKTKKKKKKSTSRARSKPAKKKASARSGARSGKKKVAKKLPPKKPSKKAPAAKKPSPKKAAPLPPEDLPKLVPVPLPEGFRPQRTGEPNERSAHLDKLKQLFESAPISRYLGMTLGYCENGVARVRLPFRKDFEEGHGVIHGGLIGLLADTAGNFAVGSVSPGSTVKTVEFKLSLLAGVQGDLLAIGEVVRKGRTLATCRLEVVEGNDRVVAIGLATYALQAI